MMKYTLTYCLVLLLSITSCSIDSDTNQEEQNYQVFWHLRNVSGGVSGVDDDFELETIVWTFNETTSMLNIENNNTDDTKQEGLPTGDYTYSVIQSESRSFLVIGGTELGEITSPASNLLVINENEKSTGTGADGFIYTFQRELVAE